jgi:hypothetical protein
MKKSITVQPLFRNYITTMQYSSLEDPEAVLVSERNTAGLKKPSSFV